MFDPGRLFLFIFLQVLLLGPFSSRAQDDERETGNSDPVKAEYYFIEGEKYFILEDYAKAFVLFKKSLEYDSGNAAAYFKIAQLLIEGKDLDKALGYAQRAMALDPGNKYYCLAVAEVLTKQSNFAQAATVYEDMMARIPDAEHYLFDLAALYIYDDDFEKAIAVYNQAEKEFGITREITYQKQKIFLRLNRLEDAIAEGKKLIAAYPSETEYQLQLSEILMTNDRGKEALVYLEKLMEEDPDNARGRLMIAEIYRQQGQMEKAEENLMLAFANPTLEINPKLKLMVNYINEIPSPGVGETALQLAKNIVKAHPSNADAYAIYGDLLMALDSTESARDKYLEAINLNNGNFSVWQNILDIELKLNELDSVLEHTSQALEIFPNQAALYYFGGTASYLQKNYEESVAYLEQGKRLASSNPQLLNYFNSLLGDSYNSLKQYDKSDEAYEAVLRVDPNNSHVLNNYSYFLSLRKENLEKAKIMSSNLVEAHPDDPTFLDTHAWVLYMMGDYEKARKVLEKAISHSASGTIIEHYGDVLFQLGETEQAVEQWKKAKGMDETSELIDKKIANRRLYE